MSTLAAAWRHSDLEPATRKATTTTYSTDSDAATIHYLCYIHLFHRNAYILLLVSDWLWG